MRKSFTRLIRLLIAFFVLAAAAAAWYATRPLSLREPVVDVEIAKGSSMRSVAQQVYAQGIDVQPFALAWLARIAGRASKVKAGNYRIEAGITAWGLVELLSAGSNAYVQIPLIEGWSFRQLRAALDAQPDLQHDTLGLSDAQVLEKLAIKAEHPEGLFFPDTYHFTRGTSDLEVLRRAHSQMQEVLAREWATRATGLPLKTAYEGLVLASVVEKETGLPADRDKVASVFINRLKIGMPLQSDPTVIYGMGSSFDGNLRRRDLQNDTPHNTYTRPGLPPTPIAMPGLASLRATFNPPQTRFLYFVARGDGSSYFSASLDEHNKAVARFQKGRR